LPDVLSGGDTSNLPRGTVTFLFTDIEGSTELLRTLGSGYGDVRTEHGALIESACGANEGLVIDTQGDAYFAAFERAGDAVAAAVDVQRKLSAVEWPEGTQLRVRIGLHTAEPFLHSSGYVGIGVHRAARICAAAHGGQILVSNATAGIIEDLDLRDVELRDLGEFRLKDITRPQRLFQLSVQGLEREFPAPTALDDKNDPYGRVGTLFASDIIHWGEVIRTLGDDAAAEIAAQYRGIVLGTVEANAGVTLEAAGDNVIAVFESPRDAVVCAAAVRTILQQHPWPSTAPSTIAFAIHTGRLVTREHGGASVMHLGRLLAEAEPWQVLVSHATEALLEGERLEPLALRDLGDRELRGFESPQRLFELVDRSTARSEDATIQS
jgi:class 3 adenylate cyclase